MILKRMIVTLVATAILVVAPFMLGYMYLALHTLARIDLIAAVAPALFIIFLVIFFFRFSSFFGERCLSKEGIRNRGGWFWIAILVIATIALKLLMTNVVSKSGYFTMHTLKHPDLPASPGVYYFSASDEEVCFTLKSSGKKSYKILSRSCYKRNVDNVKRNGRHDQLDD